MNLLDEPKTTTHKFCTAKYCKKKLYDTSFPFCQTHYAEWIKGRAIRLQDKFCGTFKIHKRKK